MWHAQNSGTANTRFDGPGERCFLPFDDLCPEYGFLDDGERHETDAADEQSLKVLIHGARHFQELTEKHRHVAHQFVRAARAAHRSGDATKASIYLSHAHNAHQNAQKNSTVARHYAREARVIMSAQFRHSNEH